MLNILLWHHISKASGRLSLSLFMVHASDPYSNVAHVYVLITLILVGALICLLKIIFLILRNAPLAIPVIRLISLSLLPSYGNVLHKYFNLLTCWMGSLPMIMLQVGAVLLDIIMQSVLLFFDLQPHLLPSSADPLHNPLKLIY